jgi:diguanylate cyclase (GGDEF)-like protein
VLLPVPGDPAHDASSSSRLRLILLSLMMRSERIQDLRAFLERIQSADTVEHTLQHLVDAAAGILKAEKVSVVVRAETGLLQVRALHWPASDPSEGISGQVLASGEPLLVTDAGSDPRLERYRSPRYRSRSFLSVPIGVEGSHIAVLNLTDRSDGSDFSSEDLELAGLLAQITGMNLERHRFLESIERLQKESVTDALTSLGNRRHFEQRITSEVNRARRFGHPLSLIILDIDDFKIYNDTLGHPAGDRALRAVSEALLENVRAIDDVVRYGGEEFAVILPQTPIDLATVVAERVRGAMGRLPLDGINQLPRGEFSVSVGVASFPRDARDESELLNHADIALYLAKAEGKNQTVVFEPLNEDERRTHRRIPIRLPTTVEGEDEHGRFQEETLIRNISAGGALFAHARQIILNSDLELHIQSPFRSLGGDPLVLAVAGRLIRSDRLETGFSGAVAFNDTLSRFS